MSESRIASELVALFPKHSMPIVMSESRIATELVAHVPKHSVPIVSAAACLSQLWLFV